MVSKKITTCDCETDPFLHGRNPLPFIWGFYDGLDLITFDTTIEFVEYVKDKPIIIYAHNGGKFDFMYLLPYLVHDGVEVKAQIINGRIVSMPLGKATLIDSFAAVPQSLGSIQKDTIEYWKLERENRTRYRAEIIDYMRGDCVYLYNLMVAYRQTAGTKKTIASNALAHAKKLGINPGTTNHRFDANYRPFYFGGRTQCFQRGTHKNIRVFDIKSSYPRAMMETHASGEYMRRVGSLEGMTRDEIQRCFLVIECDSAGAFPIRSNTAQGLDFPHRRDVFNVTGWEYVAAKELGLIENENILSVRAPEKVITFSDYVNHWYKYKEDHGAKDKSGKLIDPINYTIGKIMMNSLYGKMAQNPERYHDYKILPIGSPLPCKKPILDKKNVCKICNFHEYEHGWLLHTTYEGKEFHHRPSLWKYQYRYGIEWEAKPLYKNVATGASITGYARAALLRGIHALGAENVIYCDTDSLVVKANADCSMLQQGKKIGDWDIEIDNAPTGHFAGKKLYAIDLDNGKACTCNDLMGCKRHKVVTKGGKLTFAGMKNIATDPSAIETYMSPAPSFSIARGTHFIVRNIRATG